METVGYREPYVTQFNHLTTTFDSLRVLTSAMEPPTRRGDETGSRSTQEVTCSQTRWSPTAPLPHMAVSYGQTPRSMACCEAVMTSGLPLSPGVTTLPFPTSSPSHPHGSPGMVPRVPGGHSSAARPAAAAVTPHPTDSTMFPAEQSCVRFLQSPCDRMSFPDGGLQDNFARSSFSEQLNFPSPAEDQRLLDAEVLCLNRSGLLSPDEDNVPQLHLEGLVQNPALGTFPLQRDCLASVTPPQDDRNFPCSPDLLVKSASFKRPLYRGAERSGAVDQFAARKKSAKRRRRRVQTGPQRQAANQRERNRMSLLNTAFEALKKKLPHSGSKRHPSRIQTLRSAIDYIQGLSDLLLA